jgi:hypothetical protein
VKGVIVGGDEYEISQELLSWVSIHSRITASIYFSLMWVFFIGFYRYLIL